MLTNLFSFNTFHVAYYVITPKKGDMLLPNRHPQGRQVDGRRQEDSYLTYDKA
jgi:hypothetical protein